MIDGPSAIDPQVADGPLAPVESLRPAPSLQRVLILDTPQPQMVDLAEGNVRPYENGPPVSVPMTSTRFDLSTVQRLQVQVLRDPRPTSSESTLFSLDLADAGVIVDVRETPGGLLVLDTGTDSPVNRPIGVSSAVVIVVEHSFTDDVHAVEVSARNAETLDMSSIALRPSQVTHAMVTIGGPTVELTGDASGQHGRRRTIPVHIDARPHAEPIEQVRRAVRRAKRVASTLRGRVG